MDGIKHVLGIWVQAEEGASFWAHVCAELANRGVSDVLIVCCDGLTGLPEAIEATWPGSMVQTCVVHLIRSSMRFVSYRDRKKVAAALVAGHAVVLEAGTRLELADLLGAAEAFGQEMDEGGVEVVDGVSVDGQLRGNAVLSPAHAVRLRSPALAADRSVPDPAW